MIDIRIDTSSLTYTQFLTPELSSEFVEGADAPVIRLEPGVYGFQQKSGSAAKFRFEVTPGGLIDYDIANEEFLDGRGTSTLTVRGFTITLDARPLSHDLLPMVVGATTLPRDRTHELTLVPAAGYGFQPAAGIVADFHFAVEVNGEVVVDPRFAGFATASGRTLTINGYRITIDGRQLSHALLPVSMLGEMSVLSVDRTHEFTYIPAAGYGFQPAAGIVADFHFAVDVDGQVVVDPRFAGFAQAMGRTLTLSGYRITIDGRQLSHALLPVSMLGEMSVLSADRTHEFTYIPAAGYGFQPAAGIVADFRFDVDVDGQVVVEPRYAGFAQAMGRTLTLSGYRITIDGRQLSHALLPVSMLGEMSVLSADRTHEFTYIPAAGYGFQPAAGALADFHFAVDVNGEVVVDPRFAGFATASGRTLTINGYRITIDGRALSHDLLPLLLGWTGGALSNASTHELTLVPAVGGYTFLATDGSGNLFTLTLDIDGTVSVSPAGTGGFVAQTRQEYKGHRIELRARVGGLELLIDDGSIRYGQLPDGRYALHEYAYDWRDNLMDLARRFIDYRDRAEEIRRSRVR